MSILALAACVMPVSSFAQSNLVINGATDNLEENIRLLVAQLPEPKTPVQFRRYIDSLPDQVNAALSAFGYYAAQVQVSTEAASPNTLESIADKTDQTVTHTQGASAIPSSGQTLTETQISVNITLNDPVRIVEFSLELEPLSIELQTPDVEEIERLTDNNHSAANANKSSGITGQTIDFAPTKAQITNLLAIGKPFVSAEYEAAKTLLLTRAQNLGYFDFTFTKTEVRVSRNNSTAQIALVASPGPRYTFGNILFQQRTFRDSFMNRWLSFAPDDPYDSNHIGDLTQNLQNSGYFSSVRVRPLVDRRYGKTVPVAVDLTEIEHNKVALGIGFSTDTGIRGTVTWDKPLINSLGHSAEWSTSISRTEQSATFSYRIPRDKQPLFNYWGLEYGLKREEIDDIESRLNTVNFQRVSRTPKDWTESLFLRLERETSVTSGVEDNTTLVLPGFSYSRSRSKGQPFLSWGQSIDFQLMGGSKRAFSSIDFLKMEARFRYLRAFFDKHAFIGTLQYGAIHASDNDRIPASQRFFVGGDRTVRGFAYRSLSPLDDDGEAIGGRFLEVLSAEYNYRFQEQWSGALFTDAGRAFNSFSTGYSVGAGFGLRWQSPVGAFRVDIAAPVSDNNTGSFRIHLSLGADL